MHAIHAIKEETHAINEEMHAIQKEMHTWTSTSPCNARIVANMTFFPAFYIGKKEKDEFILKTKFCFLLGLVTKTNPRFNQG
jgi:hypothetical protein